MNRRRAMAWLGTAALTAIRPGSAQAAGSSRPDSVLVAVNDWVNRRYRYERDTADLWLTPLELHGSGAGDCEDLAICKMHLLQAYGIQARLAYVHHVTEGAHMVCVVDGDEALGPEPVVLDNLARDIIPLSARNDLELRLWFDARGISNPAGTRIRPPTAVYQWGQNLARWQWQQPLWRMFALPEARDVLGS